MFDVVVIGGGHAGCEAALLAARRGARVALVTMMPDQVGAMSCNPAIGGIGKGHLVREVDVFGGLIARCADRAAIHYRMLNRSRGRAVWGPRVQADRALYKAAVQNELRDQPRLSILSGEVSRLCVQAGHVTGVMLADGSMLEARAVVVASGTFLRGRLFTGRYRDEGGRVGEPPAVDLARQLAELSPVTRLKTGTPPRLDARSVDWSSLPRQDSDADRWTMAQWTPTSRNPQIACAITRTNEAAHAIIVDALVQSPLLSGDIVGPGPRYCPSIEDKVRRFPSRDGHQVFLEPEGLASNLVYPNGISTSLPPDCQGAFLHAMDGLHAARIVQPGYAVEYDMLDPRRLSTTLEHRELKGLFLAGQVNGTTGYEEAAAQGMVAGLNAAARACGRAPIIFDRAESYTGVMIDDLTLQGVTEPYRMLTARAENRLHLRSDNAEARLFPTALAAGCLTPSEVAAGSVRMDARAANNDADCSPELIQEKQETARYAVYVARAQRQAELASSASVTIPPDFDYAAVAALSAEMRQRLAAARPLDIQTAARVRGVTSAAITALMIACRRHAA